MLRRSLVWTSVLILALCGSTVSAASDPVEAVSRGGTVLRSPRGMSIVSWARASQLFVKLQSQDQIAYRYPVDGCYARAHLMGRMMMAMGLQPAKVWAFDDQAMGDKKTPPRLYARTPHHPAGSVSWKYHVAPILGVRMPDGKLRMLVIDPSLFDGPVTLAKWRSKMIHPSIRYTPRLEITSWSQPPTRPDGSRYSGHGYWPGNDPARDLDRLALSMMAKYKPLEGTNRRSTEPKNRATARTHPDTRRAGTTTVVSRSSRTNPDAAQGIAGR